MLRVLAEALHVVLEEAVHAALHLGAALYNQFGGPGCSEGWVF